MVFITGQTGVNMGRRKQETNETYEERQERFNRNFEMVQKHIYRKEVTFNIKNYVVMANTMVKGTAGNLSLVEMKLLRTIIAETEKDDKELFEYSFRVKDLANLLGLNPNALYKNNYLEKMTEHLMREVVHIEDKTNDHWKKFHWVDVCEYQKGILTVKISDELKPYLIGLQGYFARYRLEEIINLKSMYAIRIYEILIAYMNEYDRPHADTIKNISISIDELRRITDTTDKFERISNFRKKVIDVAIDEINQKTMYHVEVEPYSNYGKTISGYDFTICSSGSYSELKKRERKRTRTIEIVNDVEPDNRQMELSDFEKGDDFRPI